MVSRSDAFDFYKQEYLYWDGTETVTYKHEGVEIENATGRKLDWSQVAASFNPADFNDSDQPWAISVYTLGNTTFAEPPTYPLRKDGKIVTANGTEYVIRSASLERHATQYNCICSRLPNVGE